MVASAGNANESLPLPSGFPAYTFLLRPTESRRRRFVLDPFPPIGHFRAPAGGRYEPGPALHAGAQARSLEDLRWKSQ
jgi:hypothetical protein